MWSQLNRGTCFTGSRGFTDPDKHYLDGLIKEPTYASIAISRPNYVFSISKILYGFKFVFGLRIADYG